MSDANPAAAIQKPDTMVTPTSPPPTELQQVESMVGNLARPLALLSVAAGTSFAIVHIAQKCDGNTGAAFMTVVLGGLAVLYGAKSLENAFTAKTQAGRDIEVAKATGSSQ